MDALLMCGGRGTRLDVDREKPLVAVDGRPLVDRVADALRDSSVDRVLAVTSPHAPATRDHVPLPTIDAPGDGYVADLTFALERVARPVLTVAADLPLLEGTCVDAVLDTFEGNSVTVCVPVALKRELGVSVDTTVPDDSSLTPAGINVVAGGEDDRRVTLADPRLAVNANRVRDLQVAEALLRSGVDP